MFLPLDCFGTDIYSLTTSTLKNGLPLVYLTSFIPSCAPPIFSGIASQWSVHYVLEKSCASVYSAGFVNPSLPSTSPVS
jgi:hypothetical protein